MVFYTQFIVTACLMPMCDEDIHLTCSSIEEYIKYDHHCSLLLAQAEAEDMKALKGMYGETVL